MELGKTLIDAASAKTGMSRYAMSKKLQVSDGFISRVYTGKDPVPPALAARLAILAGIDARRAALEAMVSQEKNADVRAELQSALGVVVPYPESTQVPAGLLRTVVFNGYTNLAQLSRYLIVTALPIFGHSQAGR